MATERPHTRAQLAAETRKRFVAEAGRAMTEICSSVQDRLTSLMNEAAPNREMQARRDAWTAYQKARGQWLDGTLKAWQKAVAPPTVTARARIADDVLQLVDTDVTENRILASRLTRGLIEKVSVPMDDLRVRIKQLEDTEDFDSQDIFRPEVLMLALIEQWAATGMPRDSWGLVHEAALRLISDRFLAIYNLSNDFLIHHGVLPTIQLKDRVKRLANGSRSHPFAVACALPKTSRRPTPRLALTSAALAPVAWVPCSSSHPHQPHSARAAPMRLLGVDWVGRAMRRAAATHHCKALPAPRG